MEDPLSRRRRNRDNVSPVQSRDIHPLGDRTPSALRPSGYARLSPRREAGAKPLHAC